MRFRTAPQLMLNPCQSVNLLCSRNIDTFGKGWHQLPCWLNSVLQCSETGKGLLVLLCCRVSLASVTFLSDQRATVGLLNTVDHYDTAA